MWVIQSQTPLLLGGFTLSSLPIDLEILFAKPLAEPDNLTQPKCKLCYYLYNMTFSNITELTVGLRGAKIVFLY